ncbi:hypothetical protein AVT69_gp031 [Pseudomonas phage PhiPA3]|uniref:Uncharacterized protein 030 n=1 Tax=Pseudomonas phage PhiPA3 TaxID=998086 RepID=F8SJR2_BPPA3|nr:hypothetical protein AVT69_gp031 [Pseudomonas phage PhiPA3]AEH03457.1 hypothetical protein [Pseudomonas phage PhiPA3]
MAKTAAKKLDELMAAELNLKLPVQTAMIHHAVSLKGSMEGFIFAYEHDGLVFYDRVDMWDEVNGMRLRIARFKSHPVIEDRLNKRLYRRWYVWGNGLLVPVNICKVDDLKDRFYFLIDDDPSYRTINVMPDETLFIRKKPLQHLARVHPGWGVKFNRVRECAVA